MSVPPPSSSFAPPSGGNALRDFPIALEAERSWKRRRAGDDELRLSALGATLEHERTLRAPLTLPLGMLQIGIVERGSGGADKGKSAIHDRILHSLARTRSSIALRTSALAGRSEVPCGRTLRCSNKTDVARTSLRRRLTQI